MKRRILCFVLTMAMVLSMLVVVPATIASADSYDVSISTAAELREFRDAVNNGDYNDGIAVCLTADIDLSGENWSTSIGNSTNPFKGTFDGQGHTISGLTRTGSTFGQSGGLFGTVSSLDGDETTITNFKLAGSITGTNGGENVGTVVCAVKPSASGEVTVSITGIWSTVNFDASSAKMTGVGGILGTIAWLVGDYMTTVNIDSCRYSGTLNSPSAGSNDYGGIMGYPKEACGPRTINITNCIFDGSIVLYGSSPDDNGGIVGYFKGNGSNGRQTNIYISDCIVAGKFEHKNTSSQTVTGYVVSEKSGNNTDYAVTNVYYCDDSDRHTGGAMGGWYGYMKGGSTDPTGITKSNVTAKTMTQLKAMTSGFADDTKWHFGESSELPVPAMIYDNIISNVAPSIFDDMSQSEFTITTSDQMEEFANLVTAGTDFAGKTIKLGANVALETRVGYTGSSGNRRWFSGNFDGQGHTVTITQSFSNPDGDGGLFSMVRIPENGTITIKDVHVTGTITLTNSTTGKGYTGGLISAVDAGLSGNGGTINIQNVWNTVRINCGNANASNSVSGFIGFVRHESGVKPITINIDSCLWDGVINSGPAMYDFGGFVAYTGNNITGRQPVINITNSVAAGTFMSNIDGWNQRFGTLTSYLKGSSNPSDDTAKVTVNISDVISITKATFAKATGSESKIGLIEQVDGNTELNLSNIYYKTFERTGVEGDFPVVASGEAHTTENVEEKTQAELLELTASDFTDPTKWDKTDSYYPCPVGIVNVFGETPNSLYVELEDINVGTAEALNALATAVNGGKDYAGKTIHITADITIESGWNSIGITSSKPFLGNFNGHGHTIEIHQTLSNPDGIGGLIGFVRTPASGTSTIENVHVTGRIDATNSNTGSGYFGGLIACVDGNTSGSGGTININNVWNSLYINCGNSNMWTGVGGYIGFVRHADGLKPLTINFDSCLWDGTLNVGPAAYHFGGFVGYTGNNKAGRTLEINIANSVAAGTIALNQTWDQYAGLLVGYARGGYTTDDATAKVTVNVNDVISNGKMTFKTGAACPGSGSKIGHIGRIDDTTNNEINMTNLYYNAFERGNLEGNAPALGNGSANTSTNVEAKTKAEIYYLTTAAFSDASKWNIGTGHNPCPAGIVTTFGAVPSSLNVDPTEFVTEIEIGSVAEFLAFRDSVNSGTTYSGKTVLLTADIDLAGEAWVGIGSRNTGDTVFSGTFDGQGHTISNLTVAAATTETGGLFCQAGNATIQNFTLTGTITTSGNVNFMGSVINCVYGNTTLRNVRSLVNFTPTANGSQFFYCGGLVGFIHNSKNTNLTIDGCEYAGNINTGGQTNSVAGILGYTGWGNSGVTKTVTITNTFFTGSINFNDNQYYENNAGFIGYVNRADNGGTITVNISNSYSAGRLYFTRSKAWTAENNYKCAQLIGQVKAGVTLNIDSTVVYKEAYLYTQVENEKPVESSKVVLGEIGLYGSEYSYDTPAVVASMDVTFGKRDVDDQYKGIRFTATFTNVGACTGGGTASANFGIFLMTRETYEILGGAAVTKSQLVDNNSVVQVKATKFQNNTSSYVVNAVVFNLNTATRQATELVAIAYAGSDLGNAVTTTYNEVFN